MISSATGNLAGEVHHGPSPGYRLHLHSSHRHPRCYELGVPGAFHSHLLTKVVLGSDSVEKALNLPTRPECFKTMHRFLSPRRLRIYLAFVFYLLGHSLTLSQSLHNGKLEDYDPDLESSEDDFQLSPYSLYSTQVGIFNCPPSETPPWMEHSASPLTIIRYCDSDLPLCQDFEKTWASMLERTKPAREGAGALRYLPLMYDVDCSSAESRFRFAGEPLPPYPPLLAQFSSDLCDPDVMTSFPTLRTYDAGQLKDIFHFKGGYYVPEKDIPAGGDIRRGTRIMPAEELSIYILG
ncbi:hypothetical protein D9611_013436 [Ephemerocybe angulata]|uniref:Uncharacterized protein n=1 Tax=Ephemerocybe angulata TaxID=980116 RepID=A0A8H5BV88_9AGAR|nr:hypothetical protein D9611_013436 [Tulosesus angulatus]